MKKGRGKRSNPPARRAAAAPERTVAGYETLVGGITELLEAARRSSAPAVHALMTATYWEIGRRIVEYEQGGKDRAEYGARLIERLAGDLTCNYGRGFSRQNLWQMRAFQVAWPMERLEESGSAGRRRGGILQTPSGESWNPENLPTSSRESSSLDALARRFSLPWSAYVRLLSVKSEAARHFYENEALRGGWSVRQLDRQIQSQFYERRTLS